jgi:FAD:protein FMN transferase
MINYRILPIILLLCCTACGTQRDIRPVTSTRIIMDTYVTFTIYNDDVADRERKMDLDSAFAELHRVENLISSFVADSKISEINRQAGKKPVAIPSEVHRLLQQAIVYSNKSDGDFDITVKPLMNLWDLKADRPSKPFDWQVEQWLPMVNWRNMELTPETAYLNEQGMGIDMGAIGKGYAVDQGMKVLIGMGHDHVVANAGGDLLIYNTTGREHVVGVRHPAVDIPDSCVAEFSVVSGGIATSGNYERYFIEDGVRYHHILNPHTGFPANISVSATIITQTAMDADVLATAAFVKGPVAGIEYLESLPGVEGIIYYRDGEKICDVVTSGMVKKYGYQRYADDS